ncbi:MAG: hypothetical protein QOH59_532, partial [Gemmatimonadales bacterium]|nr:hypothetical protein [Gemmatimonadales bacterium]
YPRRLLEMQESERQSMARELHDEIGQVLTSLGIMLELVPRLPREQVGARIIEAQAVLDGLIGQVRNLALDLRPAVLDDLGLLAALLWLFDRYTGQSGVQVHFEQHGLEERRFDAEIEITAYRIIQEALTNVARHAGVRRASVRVWATSEVLRLQIEDLGAGFSLHSHSSGGVGLTGMRQRATIAEGRLTIDSSPGAGTRITAELPLGDEGERHSQT